MNDQLGSGRVLCSTGAVITRRNNRDFNLLQTLVPRLHCDALEFMMYESWHDQVDELRCVMADFDVPVFHMTKQIGEWVSEGNLEDALAMFCQDCELAAAMGSKLLVLHLWSGRASDQHIERNIAAYPALRDIAEKQGLLLTVENVLCNQQDPLTHLRELADVYPDIAFTWDTKMAAFHQQEEALYLAENAWLVPCIKHYHVNDYAGGFMDWANMSAKPLGHGYVDFDKFFAFVRRTAYAGALTCEAAAVNDDGTVRCDEMNASLDRIKREVQP